MKQFHTIVIGLGAMGTAAAFHLARRGARVLGLEQFQLGHDRGSSHGETRLIRKAYFESPEYVPLLQRAYELWDELALASREEILVRNGLVLYGRPESSQVYKGTLASSRQYNIPVEELSREEAARRWPLYRSPVGFQALFEPGAGFLHAERAVKAHAAEARKAGALLHENEAVLGYECLPSAVRVRTSKAEYEAQRLVVAGGGWSAQLLRELGLPLTLRRMLLGWFRAGQEHALKNGTPCFVFDLDDDFYYGFPMLDGRTFKIAGHHGYQLLGKPEEKDSEQPGEERIEALRGCIRTCLPQATEELEKAVHCIYTMTPDENFVIDLHPSDPRISIAAGFSGHGFKFSSVVGEILADLALQGSTRHPIGFLGAGRFRK